jgi:hypothetical protein
MRKIVVLFALLAVASLSYEFERGHAGTVQADEAAKWVKIETPPSLLTVYSNNAII